MKIIRRGKSTTKLPVQGKRKRDSLAAFLWNYRKTHQIHNKYIAYQEWRKLRQAYGEALVLERWWRHSGGIPHPIEEQSHG